MGPIVALLVVLALGAGAVYAAIPNNGTYYACLTKSTGAIKVINYPKVKCAKGQMLIKWSQQGPGGPQGVQGPKGDPGPADWNAIANKPAGFADGVDDGGYVTATYPCNNPIAAGGEVLPIGHLPRNMVHQFQLIPTMSPYMDSQLFIDRVEWMQENDSTLWAGVRIDDRYQYGAGTCSIRLISFTQGISVAKAKRQLQKVEVGDAKRPGR